MWLKQVSYCPCGEPSINATLNVKHSGPYDRNAPPTNVKNGTSHWGRIRTVDMSIHTCQ